MPRKRDRPHEGLSIHLVEVEDLGEVQVRARRRENGIRLPASVAGDDRRRTHRPGRDGSAGGSRMLGGRFGGASLFGLGVVASAALRVGLVALATLATLAVVGSAEAAAPPNDNYLSSFQMMNGSRVAREYRDAPNTAEAGTQSDLFNPNREGLPFGGGGPENTQCGGTVFGRTVWYDFIPEVSGGVEIVAAGYDTVVAVHEYDVSTSRITRTLGCQNNTAGLSEEVLITLLPGARAYTVQIGGVGGAGGPLDFSFAFFGDRDGDLVLDVEPDECPRLRGIRAAGGCPPELHASPALEWDRTAGGLRFTRAIVRSVSPDVRIQFSCRRCGVRRATVRARGPVVPLKALVGRLAPPGAQLQIFITRGASGSGRFSEGAFGNYFLYEFGAEGIRKRVVRCLRPNSMTPRRQCK
jgi:hypothetical protein